MSMCSQTLLNLLIIGVFHWKKARYWWSIQSEKQYYLFNGPWSTMFSRFSWFSWFSFLIFFWLLKQTPSSSSYTPLRILYSMKQLNLERAEKWRRKKIRQYLTLTCKTPIPRLPFFKNRQNDLKNMAVIQPRPTHILYQCAKFGDDRTSFNVMFDVCDI